MLRLLLVVVLLSVPLAATSGPPPIPGPPVISAPPSPSGAVSSQEYRLHSREMIRITVLGEDELSREVTIRPDGKISLPLIKEASVGGLTVPEVEDLLTRRYAAFLRNPQITVEITRYRRVTARVMGEVKAPGIFDLEPEETILDVVFRAGGATPQGNLSKVALYRHGQLFRTINIGEILWGGDLSENLPIEPGDQVLVPAGKTRLLVLGKVGRPGAYDFIPGEGALDLIMRAGGVTDEADRATARLVREPATGTAHPPGPPPSPIEIPIPLNRLLAGDRSIDVSVQPGDLLIVPETTAKVMVLGEVTKIGLYPLKPGETALDAINQAGGLAQKANKRKITILRRKGETAETLTLDLDRIVKERDPSKNPVLQGGDVVFVPTHKPFKLTDILTALLFFTKEITVK